MVLIAERVISERAEVEEGRGGEEGEKGRVVFALSDSGFTLKVGRSEKGRVETAGEERVRTWSNKGQRLLLLQEPGTSLD